MKCFWSIVSVLVLILIGAALAMPVIEQEDSVLAILTDLQSGIQSGNATTDPYKEEEARKKFDEGLVKAAAEYEQRIDSENAALKQDEADEERIEENDRAEIAHPPVHMTPEEKALRLAEDIARRDKHALLKKIFGQYASQTVAARNAHDAEAKKIADALAAGLMDQNGATAATMQAGATFQAALQTAIDQQQSAMTAAESDYDAAEKKLRDRFQLNLNQRQFEKLQEEKAEAADNNEKAEERLREKLAVKADAETDTEVKAMEDKTPDLPPREDEKDKTFSEMMTEMVEVFQEVKINAEAPRGLWSCVDGFDGSDGYIGDCGKFSDQQSIQDACEADPACKGYSYYDGKMPGYIMSPKWWCLRTSAQPQASPFFRLCSRPPETCNEAMSGRGADYRGCQTKTKSGHTCRRWDTQSGFQVENMQLNFCRNPDPNEPTISCYTTDPNVR